jgi:cytochrome c oxidase subunit 2
MMAAAASPKAQALHPRRAMPALIPVLMLPGGLAHAEGPMAYLRTYGPAGYPVTALGWGLGIISVIVVVIIGILLLGGIFRPRRGMSRAPEALAVNRDAGGMSWIYIGVGISSAVLLGCIVWTLVTISAIASPAGADALTIHVIAHQWWWEVHYVTPSGPSFTTANEIHIMVNQPVRIELASDDVIHSFWVPQIAGKMDVIPGQTNITWLQADKPGTYRGQCAVFCGAQHAHMALLVIVDKPKQFQAWWNRQRKPAPMPVSADARHGQQVFGARCAACHTVRGTDAGGIVGPDLTHLMSRHTLAAGTLPNNRGNLAAWISDPQGVKYGSRMPNLMLSPSDLSAVVAYLDTLK